MWKRSSSATTLLSDFFRIGVHDDFVDPLLMPVDLLLATPVLLLDEVLAELDVARRRYLLAQVGTVEQALLTSTDPEMFGDTFREQALMMEVRGGLVITSKVARGLNRPADTFGNW